MVNEQFGVHTEEFVEQFLVFLGLPSHIAHGIHAIRPQFLRSALAHTPKIRNGSVVPQRMPVTHFIKFGNAHPVFVGRNMLCHNVHCHL